MSLFHPASQNLLFIHPRFNSSCCAHTPTAKHRTMRSLYETKMNFIQQSEKHQSIFFRGMLQENDVIAFHPITSTVNVWRWSDPGRQVTVKNTRFRPKGSMVSVKISSDHKKAKPINGVAELGIRVDAVVKWSYKSRWSIGLNRISKLLFILLFFQLFSRFHQISKEIDHSIWSIVFSLWINFPNS